MDPTNPTYLGLALRDHLAGSITISATLPVYDTRASRDCFIRLALRARAV